MNGYVVPETNDRADDAHDREVQREIDDAADTLRAHEDAAKRPPVPQPCHKCETVYAGVTCPNPNCKEDRPAFALLKKLSAPLLAVADDTDLARIARHCGAL